MTAPDDAMLFAENQAAVRECFSRKLTTLDVAAAHRAGQAHARATLAPMAAFVHRLASMTDTECDFADLCGMAGFDDAIALRESARLIETGEL